MKEVLLKGGSLARTSLCGEDDGPKWIRKEIYTEANREYGFGRWMSQLKKLRLFNSDEDTAGLFPTVLRVGTTHDTAYFDLEYFGGDYKDMKTILSGNKLTTAQIETMVVTLLEAFQKIHDKNLEYVSGTGSLYFREEVLEKIRAARGMSSDFNSFCNYEKFSYPGWDGLNRNLDAFLPLVEKTFRDIGRQPTGRIHGNPTLENILYSPSKMRVIFIDPYEESVFESKLLDYSMVRQCSHSLYGVINDAPVEIVGTEVRSMAKYSSTLNFKEFDEVFTSFFHPNPFIELLEATQFIRMLPFKIGAGYVEHAKFFYVTACHLLEKIYGR